MFLHSGTFLKLLRMDLLLHKDFLWIPLGTSIQISLRLYLHRRLEEKIYYGVAVLYLKYQKYLTKCKKTKSYLISSFTCISFSSCLRAMHWKKRRKITLSGLFSHPILFVRKFKIFISGIPWSSSFPNGMKHLLFAFWQDS